MFLLIGLHKCDKLLLGLLNFNLQKKKSIQRIFCWIWIASFLGVIQNFLCRSVLVLISILPTAHNSLYPPRQNYQCWPSPYLYTHCTDIFVPVMYIYISLPVFAQCSIGWLHGGPIVVESTHVSVYNTSILYIHFYFDYCKYEKTRYKKYIFSVIKKIQNCTWILGILL